MMGLIDKDEIKKSGDSGKTAASKYVWSESGLFAQT